MTLKKINPEDLKVGQECYIKVVTEKVKTRDGRPVLRDIAGNLFYPSNGEHIYTIDDQPNHPDTELDMLVDVASRIFTIPTYSGTVDQAAHTALNLINACKEIKEGER